MIAGIGIDIIENSRMSSHVDDHKFLSRIFNEDEIKYLHEKGRSAQRLAAHFAVKEAFFKAVGTGIANGLNFRDVCITHEDNGRPVIFMSEKVRNILESRFGKKEFILHISLSHEKAYSVANVIIESVC